MSQSGGKEPSVKCTSPHGMGSKTVQGPPGRRRCARQQLESSYSACSQDPGFPEETQVHNWKTKACGLPAHILHPYPVPNERKIHHLPSSCIPHPLSSGYLCCPGCSLPQRLPSPPGPAERLELQLLCTVPRSHFWNIPHPTLHHV